MFTHPQMVHFPISLLITAWIFEIISYFWNKESFSLASLILLVLGTIGAFIAVQTGESAEAAAEVIPGIGELLHDHEAAAEKVLYLYLGITIIKAGLVFYKKDILPWRLIILAGLAAGTFFLYRTAHYGGRLVYEWGAGVRPVLEHFQQEQTE